MRSMGAVRALAIAAAAATALVGCGSEPDERPSAVQDIVTTHVVPGYQEAAARMAELDEAITAACDAPSPGTLEAARSAWTVAAGAWRATGAARVGPAMTRRSEGLVDWPVDRERVRDLVASTDALTPTSIGSVSASSRGLGGIEEILFGAGAPRAVTEGRRCDYLRAAAGLAREETAAVLDEWVAGGTPYRDVITGRAAGGEDPQEAVQMLVREHLAVLELLVDLQLEPAVAAQTAAQRSALLGDGPAQRARADVADRLHGIRDAYAPIEGGSSLGDLLAARAPDLGERLLEQLDRAIASAEGAEGPLGRDDPALRTLSEQVGAVRLTIATEVVSLLGVTVGFSDNDGDGG